MIYDQPFFPAPEGYIVDLANPQRSGEAANFWVGTVGMIIAGLFLFVRMYTKTVLARNFTSDDSELCSVLGRKSLSLSIITTEQYS